MQDVLLVRDGTHLPPYAAVPAMTSPRGSWLFVRSQPIERTAPIGGRLQPSTSALVARDRVETKGTDVTMPLRERSSWTPVAGIARIAPRLDEHSILTGSCIAWPV